MPKRILILTANPKDTSRLRLDQEVREIDSGLQRSQKRDEFSLKQVWAARHSDVRRALLDFKPNVIHFCGHGAKDEGIAFEDDSGNTKLVDSITLATFFELFSDHVECVVLNACFSEIQAKAIAQNVDYVVGMKQEIGDSAAIEYAVGFYDALGAGKSVEFAHKLGCNAIQWAGIPEHLTPTLLIKNKKNDSPKKEISELTHYGKKPLPVVIVLDTSGSMIGLRINLMRQGIISLIKYLQSNTDLDNVETLISVITFDSEARVLIPLTPVNKIQEMPEIQAGGVTSLGSALTLLAELFGQWLLSNETLHPLIIIALDGSPTDDWQHGLAMLKTTILGAKAGRLALALGEDVDYTILRAIGNLGVLPLIHPEDMLQITNFFKWVSIALIPDQPAERVPEGEPIVIPPLPPIQEVVKTHVCN